MALVVSQLSVKPLRPLAHIRTDIFAIRPVGGLPKYPRHLANGVDNSKSIVSFAFDF